MTPDDLRAFTTEIAELFNAGQIPYPVHLSDGNEDELIHIFEDVGPRDYIFGTYRMHYHCLLRGVPRDELKAAIMSGHSMALRFPKWRCYGSAIVGGTLSHAVGAAMSIKRRGGDEKVWCFLGDMAAQSGVFVECLKHAGNHALPITFVVEDNGISVCSETAKVWNTPRSYRHEGYGPHQQDYVIHYEYRSRFPHCGSGTRVMF